LRVAAHKLVEMKQRQIVAQHTNKTVYRGKREGLKITPVQKKTTPNNSITKSLHAKRATETLTQELHDRNTSA